MFCHLIEFAFESVDVSDLVGGRFAFVTEDCSVKLVGMLTQTFLARDCATFGRGDDFLSHRIDFSVKIRDLFAKLIAFRHCGTRLGKRLWRRGLRATRC